MKNISRFTLIKAGLLVLLALLWAPYFMQNTLVSPSRFDDVKALVLKDLDAEFYPQQDNQKIKRYLALDPADYLRIEFFRTDNTLDAQELVLVQYPAGEDTSALQEQINNRIKSQMNIFEGYAPEQYALVSQNLQDYQGNYALYYVGENPSAVKTAFENALKGKS